MSKGKSKTVTFPVLKELPNPKLSDYISRLYDDMLKSHLKEPSPFYPSRPQETLFFVGGPLDGDTREVPFPFTSSTFAIPWAEPAPTTPALPLSATAPIVPSVTVKTHFYSRSPETGEMLWAGAR